MMLEFGLVLAAVLVFAALSDRQDRRHARALDRMHDSHDRAVSALLERLTAAETAHRAEIVAVFDAHRAEVQTLCQRIQAPELAVVEHQQANAPDENPYPLTDEETVEASDERARLIREMERLENEGLVAS